MKPIAAKLIQTISRHRSLFLSMICGLVFMLGCLLHYQRGYFSVPNYFHAVGSDDAFISYRYAWNLVHHNTLSWNESGFRRTEGFTNPLWVALSAAWALTGDKDLVYPGVALTSVMITTFLLVSLAYQVQKKTTTGFAWIGMLLLSVSPIVWAHTTSGLESGVFGALIGLTAYIFIFETSAAMTNWGAILIVVSVLLRSDGFIYILVVIFAQMVTRSSSVKKSIAALLFASSLLVIWRLFTFGTILPNTAVAKLSFSAWGRIGSGLELLLASLSTIIPLFAVGLQGLLNLKGNEKTASVLVISGWLAYYVYMGGDIYMERHIIGVVFLLGVLTSFHLDSMQSAWKRKLRYGLALILLMLLPVIAGDMRFEYWKPKPPDPWILLGKEMAKHREQYGVTIVSPAGKIPFFAGGDFVDELGLNDSELAAITRDVFVPGHAAGSREAAIEISKSQTDVISCFSFGDTVTWEEKDRVALWIDNVHPEYGVQYVISEENVALIRSSHPLSTSLLLWVAH